MSIPSSLYHNTATSTIYKNKQETEYIKFGSWSMAVILLVCTVPYCSPVRPTHKFFNLLSSRKTDSPALTLNMDMIDKTFMILENEIIAKEWVKLYVVKKK